MKTINSTLQTHLALPATTFCFLVRVETKDGTVIGFTNLDADVIYDDGAGAVTYSANNGFTPSRNQSTADLTVDNAEIEGWVADTGITFQQIVSGFFDSAELSIYRVNYNDLTAGRHEVVAFGTAGETTVDGLEWKTEFRSLKQQLKQPVSKLYSITCRAIFGSQPLDTTDDATPKEKYPCKAPMIWTAGAVTGIGAETDRVFADSSASEPDDFYKPGVIEWLTGDNAGKQIEVDAYSGSTFTLSYGLAFPIQMGDTYRRRQDCDKTVNDCKVKHNNFLNFRGEPLIPLDGTPLVPAAEITRA